MSSPTSSEFSNPFSEITLPVESFPYHRYTNLTEASFLSVPPTELIRHRIDFIRHSPDLILLICTQCRYALHSKSHLKKHLQTLHREYVTSLEDFSARLEDYDPLPVRNAQDLPTIEERTFYFPHLPLHFDTFKCPDCSYFSRSSKNARKHRIDVHNNKALSRKKRLDLIYGLPAQLLFPAQNRGLFIPRLPENIDPVTVLPDPVIPFDTLPFRPSNSSNLDPEISTLSSQLTAEPSTSTRNQQMTANLEWYLEFRRREAELINQPLDENDETRNPRNVSAFHLNSRLYLFPNDKDIFDLLALTHDPQDYYQAMLFERIRKVAIDLQQYLSSRIPYLLRHVRQDLKSDGGIDIYQRSKDFIELIPASRPKYFRVFADLFIFLIQLDLRRQEDRAPPREDREPDREDPGSPRSPLPPGQTGRDKNRNFLAQVTFSQGLTTAVRALVPQAQALMHQDDLDELTPAKIALQDGLIEVFYQLLQIRIPLTTMKEYTAFYNPGRLFLTLRSLKTNDSSFSWRNGDDLVKLSRQIVYGSRLFFVGILVRFERRNRAQWPDQFHDEPEFQRFYRKILPLLHISAQNYLSETLQDLRYMTKVLKQEVSTNRPVITVERDVYLIYGERYSLPGIKVMMHKIFEELKEIFWFRLLLIAPTDLPELPLETFKDNAINTTEHYYMADHPSLSTHRALLPRLLRFPGSIIATTFIRGYDPIDSSPIWSKIAITRWYRARKRFIQLLLIAIHLTGGSPLRGEELVLLLFRNVKEAERSARHLVWDREVGLVRITTYWYKSINIVRKDKANIRFLPPTLSHLLVYYLIYIYPLYNTFNVEYLGLSKLPPLLFEDRGHPLTAANLSRLLSLESVKYFRVGFAINAWRHLVNHILRLFINGANEFIDEYLDDEEEAEEIIDDSLIDRQANRTTKSGALFYSLRQDLPRQVTNDLYFKTLTFAKSYFTLFGLDKLDFSREKAARMVDHSGSIGSRVNPVIAPTPSSRPQDLAFIQELVVADSGLRVDLNEAVVRFFGDPLAQFRDKFQRTAVTTLLEGFNYLTYINKTGSGKSLLYLLPASLHQIKTIAIVLTPRISLRNDLLTRAERQKIRTVNFADITAEKLEEGQLSIADLVFVSIDSVVNSTFTIYLEILKKQGYQVTIFLDEAHLVLLEKDFRPVLKYVNGLVKYRCPFVFLSATLPPPLLNLLEQEFFIEGYNTVIRGPTLRENIIYCVEKEDPELDRVDNVREVIEKMKRLGLSSTEKAVIFIANIAAGKDLAEELCIPFYYAANPEKETILASFLTDPTSLIILATSSLAVGVDFDIIKFTLHVPPYYEMISFIQESGRIRREGTAFILTPPIGERQKERTMTSFDEMQISEITTLEQFKEYDKLALKRLVVEPRCYRRVLSSFLDNDDIIDCLAYRTNLDPDVKLCQLCAERDAVFNTVAETEENVVEQVQSGLTSFEEKLDEFELGFCLFCLFFGPVSSILAHTFKTCSEVDSATLGDKKSIIETIISTKRTIRSQKALQPKSCCFSCLLPARVCNRLKEANNLVSQDACIYPSLVITAMVILFRLAETPSFLSFDLTDLRRKTSQGFWPAIEYLISPSLLYSTDSIRVLDYLNELQVEEIISEREGNESNQLEGLGGNFEQASINTDLPSDQNSELATKTSDEEDNDEEDNDESDLVIGIIDDTSEDSDEEEDEQQQQQQQYHHHQQLPAPIFTNSQVRVSNSSSLPSYQSSKRARSNSIMNSPGRQRKRVQDRSR